MSSLTPREREVLELVRVQPLLDAQAIADRLGSTRASVAMALSSLTRKGAIAGRGYIVRDEAQVVVLGGAVMDVKAVTDAPAGLHTSNPATIRTSPGGVGRNIAEGIARLGRRTFLVAALGDDVFGRELLAHTADAGVYVDHVVRGGFATGTYLATLDHDGELVVGASDLRATDALTVDALGRARDLVPRADFLVVDGNIPADVVRWAIQACAQHDVPLLLDPVSVAKAGRLAPLLDGSPIDTVTPNLAELAALTGAGAPVADTKPAITRAAAELHERGVRRVWVRRGRRGSLLSDEGTVTTLAARPAEVVDVTGAGDAMTAAYVVARTGGEGPVAAAELGHVAAALTIAHPDNVRPDLATALHADHPHRTETLS
ncbi:PfkB family carbohydrate kinase [Nocardioides nitrophenolicus]|uniref:PfkB family carbohydrate kinase n=1 Tax=Nocardioides nitrophenolicus TaxID=60489 RepID=UPI00195A262A|nr:PfkB family carbohydrate kinase [Nocardioides nitrophenolicus]MBM7516078.1 pseudouridine kinase [Nocardioides nitrophenolicus]